ncbi:hypothetical protein EW145_g2926 [Phellinidium pouzarii]|uniref:DUF6534 domain-containing protein n=1 Tax=Phellinidium pouzarii TaxID=167371 RepID=A0A4S4LEJ1_9AGAM|nr:hypothetical protein EW145_g2926 [Phellinidium pouzarii]
MRDILAAHRRFPRLSLARNPLLSGAPILILVLQSRSSDVQFMNYYTWYKDDKWRLRWIVAVLAIATTLKSAQTLLLVWEQSIVASIGVYVQTYFCFRLYAISRCWWVVSPISAILLFAYAASIVSTYYTSTFNTPMIGHWFAAHLSAVFVGDTLLASATAFFLISTSRHGLRQTKMLVNALVRLTFQTATPAAICAMLNLVFSQVYNGQDRLVSAAFNTALPKMYAISMMYTLNARRAILIGHSSGQITSSFEQARNTHRRDDVELNRMGSLATIQIRTEIETERHVDARHEQMFIDRKLDRALNRSDDDSQSQHESKFYKGGVV